VARLTQSRFPFRLLAGELLIAVHGPGGTPDVDIFNGLTGQLVDEFLAYDPAFTGRLYVANTARLPLAGRPR
jgi:hypothetical protein